LALYGKTKEDYLLGEEMSATLWGIKGAMSLLGSG
jgi:hypothetical protein